MLTETGFQIYLFSYFQNSTEYAFVSEAVAEMFSPCITQKPFRWRGFCRQKSLMDLIMQISGVDTGES